MSSPELSQLRVNSLEKRSIAVASLQQAQIDRTLAQQSYSKIIEVATAETDRARIQLAAAQARLARQQIATAEILVLEEAADDRVHSEHNSKSESVWYRFRSSNWKWSHALIFSCY